MVAGWTASLKVAVTACGWRPRWSPPAAGVRLVTVGGVVSAGGAAAVVKVQVTGSIVLPAASWAPETVAVYVVEAASG